MLTEIPRILLVDDDGNHVALVRRAFDQRPSSARLSIASDLRGAREQIAVAAPDLVIADLRLPDGRGSELLPSKGDSATFPIIILTGFGDVIRLVEVEATNHQVTIDLQLADGLPPLTVDRVQIDQVVVNLVRNAIDAMSKVDVEHRRLIICTSLDSVRGRRDDRGGDDGAKMITVSVSDRGKGIDLVEKDRMFDAYFTTKDDSIGMGLTISRSIIKAHQGHLWARSEGRGGTTFLFSLPLVRGDDEP